MIDDCRLNRVPGGAQSGTVGRLLRGAITNHQSSIINGLLVLLCSLLFFRGLAERDLTSSHEARAAMDAQSLLDDGFATMPRQFDGRVEV
jgi:hypothetical protein